MRFPVIVAAALFSAATAQAATDVAFKNPESYIDATFTWSKTDKSRAEVQDALRKVFADLGRQYLKPTQSLSVEVTNLDLAGRFEPWLVLNQDVRIMRDVTWPAMQFTYTLTENGAEVASGTAKLSDLNYLDGFNRYTPGDPLRYEKRMLSDWFRKAIGPRVAQR